MGTAFGKPCSGFSYNVKVNQSGQSVISI